MTNHLKNENGVALIIAIMFLFVLSILIAVLYGSSIYEMQSSKKYQDSQTAFYTAETGLRMAMSDANMWATAPELQGTPPAGFVKVTPPLTSVLSESDTRWKIPEVQTGAFTYKYYVEHLRDDGSTHFYRITSEGSNSSGSVRKQIQLVVNTDY